MKPVTSILPTVILSLLLMLPAFAADNPTPNIEELWKIIQAQQAEIDALKQQQRTTAQQAAAADEKAEAAAVAVESGGSGHAAAGSWADRTTIGGYGELHYNDINADDSTYDDNQVDFQRFVLYFGHEFSDRLRFHSELEFEHAFMEDENECEFTVPAGGLAPGDTVECEGDSSPGELELEQAYLEYDINDSLNTRGGVFLLPVGILNETHEPATFYGVERNDVETIIVPTTWWGAGAGLSGRYANGISWDLAVQEGLAIPTTGDNAFRVRSGRQNSAEANASDPAYTGRIRYTGLAGLELAATINYQTDASQEAGDGLGSGILYETHAVYQNGPFALRALYARWDFDGSAVKAADANDQHGWYIEPSYKPFHKLGLYTRYEDVVAYPDQYRFDQWEVGMNFWPHEDVVLKADYRSRDYDRAAYSGLDFDAFDLGIGYQF